MKLILIGFMGSGKTTISQFLGQQLAEPVLDLDREIERQQQQTIPQIFAQSGEKGFRQIEHDVLQQSIGFSGILATGGGTPLRADNLQLLRQAGVPVILLVASPAETYRRLQQQDNRPLGNKLDVAGIRQLQRDRQPFYDRCADVSIMTDDRTPAEITQEIIKYLQK
ncbi:shikimate kinase [Lactobacillus sp. 0.1XD8-4]|uniref:Shikimate kinase n=2 Tax=Limosilactobacillus walteri TaxID=2268022 RepID=A0ABR8P6B9_9LACO|nr:shikimate kinase [uncultured Limosilactobacillus sp.]MBD5806249.1 shikimate kinase [Limosilactobacillus walteri]MRN07302.1 shikimate kinase [Lactobacillus sp. 0.1XD8-4]